MKKHFFILLFALFYLNSVAQNCTVKSLPFNAGEKLQYQVFYNLKHVWVPAGIANFEVTDTVVNNNKYWHLIGNGHTLKKFNWFFIVNDQYESVVNPLTLNSISFHRKVEEGDYKLDRTYTFDQQHKKAEIETLWKTGNENDTLTLELCSWDIITAVYYTRSIDFSQYKVNAIIPIKLILDKKIYYTYITYDGETEYTSPDKKKYNALTFRLKLIDGTLFKKNAQMKIVVTNDKNKIPLYVESEILVGSIKVYLSSMKKMKYEVSSQIK